MSGLIKQDGKYYRMRRSKLVQIPEAWVGSTLHSQTKRKRPSKQIHKRRKDLKCGGSLYSRRGGRRHKLDSEPVDPNSLIDSYESPEEVT